MSYKAIKLYISPTQASNGNESRSNEIIAVIVSSSETGKVVFAPITHAG